MSCIYSACSILIMSVVNATFSKVHALNVWFHIDLGSTLDSFKVHTDMSIFMWQKIDSRCSPIQINSRMFPRNVSNSSYVLRVSSCAISATTLVIKTNFLYAVLCSLNGIVKQKMSWVTTGTKLKIIILFAWTTWHSKLEFTEISFVLIWNTILEKTNLF